jgi:formylglycine-generating enzyme required for sulfatase activity
MGEEPDPRGNARQVDVTLCSGFWMGKYEVTQAQYQFVMGKNPSQFKGDFLPVETVSWTEANEFCEKLTTLGRKAGLLPMGWEYRLPTEAQWEYACRAGTTTCYSFGNDASKLGDYAWHLDNCGTEGGLQRLRKLDRAARAKLSIDEQLEMAGKRTHPVGQKKPNAWGLCDMHGNVMELCRDWYQHKLPGGADPEVTEEAIARTVRGGSWCAGTPSVRSAFRLWGGSLPGARGNNCGFRVAAVPVN